MEISQEEAKVILYNFKVLETITNPLTYEQLQSLENETPCKDELTAYKLREKLEKFTDYISV